MKEVGYYGIMLVFGVCVCHTSIHLSFHPYFHFQKITWVNTNGFSPNLVFALILWFGIANGQISSIFNGVNCLRHVHIFVWVNLSKCWWLFTKLGICSDTVEIWFGIASGQILSIFDRFICPRLDKRRVLLCHLFFKLYFNFSLLSVSLLYWIN